MELFLFDQDRRLADHLSEFKNKQLSYETTEGLPERTIHRRIADEAVDLATCQLDFLFAYELFPRAILKFVGEWQVEGRKMREGDVIVQQAQVPPGWGVHFLFGVRVLSVYRDRARAGFSYGTLTGHPETGTNEFSFSAIDGAVVASVRTIARPVLPFSGILAPLFVNRYIAFCNREALRRMEQSFLRVNSASVGAARIAT